MSRAHWGYLGLFFLILAACVRLLFHDTTLIALILAFVGVLSFLAYLFQSGETMRSLASQRSTREGTNVLTVSLFVLGSLVLVNLIGARIHWWQDFTADRMYTLSPETRSVLANFETLPEISVFHQNGTVAQSEMRSLLEAVELEFPGISARFVDPEKDPWEARRYNLRQFGSVIELDERQEFFTGADEAALVKALLRIRSGKDPKVALLEGHGEPIMTRGGEGYLHALVELQERSFEAESVNLTKGDTLGSDFDVVWVANPQVDLTPEEATQVIEYLSSGGNMLLLLDPDSPVTYNEILAPFGLEFIPRFIADPDQQSPQIVIGQDLSSHDVTRELAKGNVSVVFPGVGQVRRTQQLPQVYISYLIWTGARAKFVDDPSDEEAQRAMALAISTRTQPSIRILLIGDADFAKNRSYPVLGNSDFFLSGMRWLTEDTTPVSITPREVSRRPVLLSRQQGRAFTVLFVVLFPVGIIAAGTMVWWKRR